MRSNLMLLLTAFIWGSAFVAQSAGMDYIGPFTFNGVRSIIGGLVLIPVIFLLQKISKPTEENFIEKSVEEKNAERKVLITGGVICGLVLFVASSLQQIGIQFTTAGKAGFITALYIVIVPILGIFLKKKLRPIVWLCVLMGAFGLYLLCMTDKSFTLAKGDFLVLLCAFAFSVHILVIDYFSPKTDGVKLSCIQFLVAGVLGLICMCIFELDQFSISSLLQCWLPLLYAGVLSCGVGYTLQVIAQRDAEPTIASLLMSLESVFAVICGVIILHEFMTGREILGCVVMFAAIIIAQIPPKKERL